MRSHLLSVLLVLAAVGCSTSSSSPASSDDTSKFAGTWTYALGSTVVEDCTGAPEVTIDLSKSLSGRPAFFTMTASSDEVQEVDARGCQYGWSVSGDDATAAPGQSCANFPGGHGGTLVVHLQSGIKSTSDGASMNVDVHFTTDTPSSCVIHVQGTATKS